MRDRRELLDETIAAFNRQDIDGIVSYYTEDAELTVPGQPPAKGKAAIAAVWRGQLSAFPDAKLTVTRFIDTGDASIIELTFEATNNGPLQMPDGSPLPPTGKPVRLRSASVADLDGDLIKRHRVYGDNVELMAQLGLIPAPAGA